MVICLERGADLHTAWLMPLPLTVSCFSKIQIGFTFLVPAHLGSPGKGPLNGCVCKVRLISPLVSVAAHTDYVTPGCGAHLHFTGLEPAVGLRPSIMNYRLHLFHNLPFPPRLVHWYQIILFGDRSTYVWTTCPQSLRSSTWSGIQPATSLQNVVSLFVLKIWKAVFDRSLFILL